DETVAMVERGYHSGATVGSAFAGMLKELFAAYGLLLIDPMQRALRVMAAPMVRSTELIARGYHAQVLVDKTTSLAFLLQDGQRIALRHQRLSTQELVQRAADLSPNALLRPVVQDYLLPTAAYIGGPAELAYFAQSQVLYNALLDRQPAAFPRACFTLLDERSHKRMVRYGLNPTDLFAGEQTLHNLIAARLVPERLRTRLEDTKTAFAAALVAL